MKRSGARLEHVWALGANAPLEDLKRNVSLVLEVKAYPRWVTVVCGGCGNRKKVGGRESRREPGR